MSRFSISTSAPSYGFGSRILKVPSTSKRNESENIFSFKIPENLEPSEFIQNAEIHMVDKLKKRWVFSKQHNLQSGVCWRNFSKILKRSFLRSFFIKKLFVDHFPRVEVASHHAGSLENLVNKTIGVRFVNEKQENRKLRFSGSGQTSPAGVSRSGGQRLQRDTSNFQHDMHSSENEKGELNEQNVPRAINKTIVSRLTRPELKYFD